MKWVTIIILSLLITKTTIAQDTFAPINAQWYHNMKYGIFHSYVDIDTNISGKQCTRINQTAIETFFYSLAGLNVNNLSSIYVHNTSDTVFIYNDYFKKFTPLYIFNVNPGDTICLPIFPTALGALNFSITDSSFCLIVDSVKTELFDTTNLKTVYTKPLSIAGKAVYDWDGPYAQKVGGLKSILPYCRTCTFTLSDSYQNQYGLRCYNDKISSIRLTTESCDKDIKLAVENEEQNILNIYPNPVKDMLYIDNKQSNTITELFDCAGKLLQHQSLNQSVDYIDLRNFQPGVYILHITNDVMNKVYRISKE